MFQEVHHIGIKGLKTRANLVTMSSPSWSVRLHSHVEESFAQNSSDDCGLPDVSAPRSEGESIAVISIQEISSGVVSSASAWIGSALIRTGSSRTALITSALITTGSSRAALVRAALLRCPGCDVGGVWSAWRRAECDPSVTGVRASSFVRIWRPCSS